MKVASAQMGLMPPTRRDTCSEFASCLSILQCEDTVRRQPPASQEVLFWHWSRSKLDPLDLLASKAMSSQLSAVYMPLSLWWFAMKQ